MVNSSTLRSSAREPNPSDNVSSHATGTSASTTPLAQSEQSEQDRTSTPGRTRLKLSRPKRPTEQELTTPSRAKKTTNKPPTKLTVKGGGAVLQTTNGVATRLGLGDRDLSAQPSTSTPSSGNKHGRQSASAKNEDKRVLRSQKGGSRLKSDLSIYFPNYDEIISDAPKDAGTLRVDTDILIIDEPTELTKSTSTFTSLPHGNADPSEQSHAFAQPKCFPVDGIPQPPVTPTAPDRLNGAEMVDFLSMAFDIPDNGEDPLRDEIYIKAHRRAERKEKQLRNIEKERAMHEKVQLERLLDGLLGHDWLRVMGISGITDTEKKAFEPKRDYFIREVEALVEKFKLWRDEEKRQRLEKEQAQQAAEEEDEDPDDATTTFDDHPTSSDVDAGAARQLQLEASLASGPQISRHRQKPVLTMPSPEREFTSFYSKPYLREAAMGGHRRSRSKMAFGHPIPEPPEHEFSLPDVYVSEEVLVANARKRRRLKRESRDAKPA